MRIPLTKKSRAIESMLGAALTAVVVSTPAAAQDLTETLAQAAGVPQVDAFLPDKYDVDETEALPIDGVWRISTINKKIRIEKGRAYAIDSWLHLFTLKVQRDMVVLQNFERTAPGQYAADDLPLMGPAEMQLRPDGNLTVTVKGMLGPASYKLIKRDIDDENALESELYAMANPGAALKPTPPSDDYETLPSDDADSLADCETLDVDPATGDVVCMD